MAIEAQLCPQCGGSIQFAAYQTQIICPYCGTTVDRVQPPAAGAPPPRSPQLSDLPTDKLIQLSRMFFAGQRADALAFIQQNLGLDEAQAGPQLDDTDLWLPRLSFLTTSQLTQLNRMAFAGQQAEALALIQQQLGLDQAHASQQLNDKIARWTEQWRSEYRQKPLDSNAALALLAGDVAVTVIVTLAIIGLTIWATLATAALPNGHKDPGGFIGWVIGLGYGPGPIICGGYVVSLLVFLATFGGARARVRKALGKPRPASLLKVVKLWTASNPLGQVITTTHLEVQVTPRVGAPQIIDKVFDLTPEFANQLQPGTKIEVITNGPAFAYITEPIKVLG